MRKLDRKMLRDLSQMKGQAFAITMVVAAGVATLVMSLCAYASLVSSKDYFYREFRFADVFATARRVPRSMETRLAEISGVSSIETRLVYDVLLDVPGMMEPATARLISIPANGENRLNRLYIRRGRMVEPRRSGEVVVSERFAQMHQFRPGDELSAIINGKRKKLFIVGIALSPEYVIQIQPGSIFPDDRRFGVFWINEEDLEAAFDMTGAFNSVTMKLAYGADEMRVIDELDQFLKPFGSIGGFSRDQQISHQYLRDEIAGLRGMALVSPMIFLSVAAFLLNMVLARMITKQREQIAVLKAFGYRNWEVGWHYLGLVLMISLLGTILGTLFGFALAYSMTQAYMEFYKFPVLAFRVDRMAVVLSFLATTLGAVLGTWWSVRAAIRIPPAEAMRPETPTSYQATWLERLFPAKWWTMEMRMVIRNVARRPIKSMLSIVGISMAVAVMLVGNFSMDSLNYLMDFQFGKAQRQDLTVQFVEPAAATVMHEMASLPGVLDSQTVRSVPTRIHYQNRFKKLGIMGIDPAPRLYRLLDRHEAIVPVPEFGIMLSRALAEKLRVKVGDEVQVEVLEGKRPTVDVEVAAIVEEFAGLNAYMNKQQLHSLLQESTVASGAFLKVDRAEMKSVFHELESRPGVASVLIKDAMLNSFRETIAKNILIMRGFIIMFASIIAMGVVYNGAQISLSEQSRDLATMRVIGFTKAEVSSVLLGEIVLFTLAAIPLGWVVGYSLAGMLVSNTATDNYRLPLVVSVNTLALAALVVIIATLLSGWIVQRRIHRLDLIGVLKTRE